MLNRILSAAGGVLLAGSLMVLNHVARAHDEAATTPAAAVDILTPPGAAPFQHELLSLAWEAASAIPVVPHLKDRSKAQENVVEVYLQLGLFHEAEIATAEIRDWRQGDCYADLAIEAARQGRRRDAAQYLLQTVKFLDDGSIEQWRKDNIRVRIAKAHVILGDATEADRIRADLSTADSLQVVSERVATGVKSFDEEYKPLADLAMVKDFDVASTAIQALVRLYQRSYRETDHRAAIEKTIHAGWGRLPINMRLEYLLRMCETALNYHDTAGALPLLDEADAMKDAAKWPIESDVPLSARLAQLRFRAGDTGVAKSALHATMQRYEKDKNKMINTDRVTALIPVAEAYLAIHDEVDALDIYKLAAEEGVVNPNSRPRAMDLVAICRSMALRAFEPNPPLWARLRQTRKDLNDPW